MGYVWFFLCTLLTGYSYCKHYDDIVNNLINHWDDVQIKKIDRYRITLKYNGLYYEFWNANFPYAWLTVMKLYYK